ncbi:MAG: S8 family serine peptidase, partial [Thermoplasmata archaeon]
RPLSILLSLVLISTSAMALVPADERHEGANDRLIVSVSDASVVRSIERLAESHGSEMKYIPELKAVLITDWDGRLRDSIRRLTGVLAVETERKASVLFTPNDPYYSLSQWGLQKIDAAGAWDFTRGSSAVVVAVLDTGIDYTHDDLTANMWRDSSNKYGHDFINDDDDPMDDNVNGYEGGTWVPNQFIYHGTHIAGVVGAVMNNALGIAGVAQVKLMAVKVMNESGEGTDATVAEGIVYAVNNGADIITMSLGVDSSTLVLSNAIRLARDNGVVCIAAAGNDGSYGISYPAAYPSVIAVGASDQLDHRASFSNYGPGLDVMAPGTRIWSCKVGDTYQELSGTSTATPFVAGVAALMLSVNPALTPIEIGNVLNQTATDIGSSGYDTSTGWGIINAKKAVMAVSGPAATITDYPSFIRPNTTISVSWTVSGAGELPITQTYLRWGYSPGGMTHISGMAFGNRTPHTFSADDIVTPPNIGDTLYLQAVALVNGTTYESEIVTINVTAPADPLQQLIESIKHFITEDFGLFNFAMLLVFIAALIALLLIVRAHRRAKAAERRGQVFYAEIPPPGPQAYTPPPAVYVPPPSIPEIAIDIASGAPFPAVVEVEEGTRVIWRNRDWAPPPGISIISGYVDSTGPHPSGLFSSGLMVAPGEYWSVVFNTPGVYEYYIGGINVNGRIIVHPRA